MMGCALKGEEVQGSSLPLLGRGEVDVCKQEESLQQDRPCRNPDVGLQALEQ